MQELAIQTDKLKLAEISKRASHKQREETVFNVGRTACIKDCVKNACKRFPQVAWVELGIEAVEALRELEAEKTDKVGLTPQPEKSENNIIDAQAFPIDAPADEPRIPHMPWWKKPLPWPPLTATLSFPLPQLNFLWLKRASNFFFYPTFIMNFWYPVFG